MWIVVSLWIKPGKDAEFASYEDRALAIFRDHGGEVVARLRADSGPYEVHLLRIDSRTRFEEFLRDPRRQALDDLRQIAIERTDVVIGEIIEEVP